MRLIFILFIFLPHLISGQGLNEQLRDGYCNCFQSIIKDSEFVDDEQSIDECFEDMISILDRTIIDSLTTDVDIFSVDDPYEYGFKEGYKIAQSVYFDNQQYFMSNCEGYFDAINNTRDKSLVSMADDVTEEKLDYLSDKIEKLTLKNEFLWERGSYYLVLGDYTKAIEDFDRCLRDNPNHTGSLYFKGWTLEKMKMYKEAISLYNKAYKIDSLEIAFISAELTKHKMKIGY